MSRKLPALLTTDFPVKILAYGSPFYIQQTAVTSVILVVQNFKFYSAF